MKAKKSYKQILADVKKEPGKLTFKEAQKRASELFKKQNSSKKKSVIKAKPAKKIDKYLAKSKEAFKIQKDDGAIKPEVKETKTPEKDDKALALQIENDIKSNYTGDRNYLRSVMVNYVEKHGNFEIVKERKEGINTLVYVRIAGIRVPADENKFYKVFI